MSSKQSALFSGNRKSQSNAIKQDNNYLFKKQGTSKNYTSEPSTSKKSTQSKINNIEQSPKNQNDYVGEQEDSLGDLPTPTTINSVIRHQSSKNRRVPVPRRSLTVRSTDSSHRARSRSNGSVSTSTATYPATNNHRKIVTQQRTSSKNPSRSTSTRRSLNKGLADTLISSVEFSEWNTSRSKLNDSRLSKNSFSNNKTKKPSINLIRHSFSSQSSSRLPKNKGKQPVDSEDYNFEQKIDAYFSPTPASSPVQQRNSERSENSQFSMAPDSNDGAVKTSCLSWLTGNKQQEILDGSILRSNLEAQYDGQTKITRNRRPAWSATRGLENIYQFTQNQPHMTALMVGKEYAEREKRIRTSRKYQDDELTNQESTSQSLSTEKLKNTTNETTTSRSLQKTHSSVESFNSGDTVNYFNLTPDEIGRLYAKIAEDSAQYRLFRLEEHDQLCRQIKNLESRVEKLANRLALETRLRDGALELYHLHSRNKKVAAQIEEQYRLINRRMDQLCLNLWRQTRRAWCARRSLLEHQVHISVRVADELESAWHTLQQTKNSTLTEDEVIELTAMLEEQKIQLDHANLLVISKTQRIRELEEQLAAEQKYQQTSASDTTNAQIIAIEEPINHSISLSSEKSLNHYSLVQIQELQQELNGMRQREVHYIEIIQQQAKKLHSTNVGSSGFSNESIRDNNEISDKLLDDLVTDSKMSANNALIVQNLEENLLQANSNTDFYHLRVNEYESTMQNLYVQLQAAFAISNVPSYSKYSNENSQEKAAIYKTENDDLLHLKFQQTEPLFMDGRALSVVNNAPYSLEAFSRGIIQLLDRYRRLVIHQQLVASGQAENAEGHAWSASVSNFPIPGTNVLSAQYPTNNTKRADSSIAIPSTIFNPPVSSFETQNESKAAWDQARAQTVYQHLNQFPSPRTSEDHPTASRGSDNNERIRLLEDEIELLRERDTQARMFIARLGRKNNQDQTSSSSLN